MIKFLKYFLASLLFAGAACAQTPGQNSGGVYPFGYYSSYSGVALDVVVAATATDIVCISGSASRTVIVKHLKLSGFATNNAVAHAHIVKRSTANTGGTSTTPTIVSNDGLNASATAVVRAYTANPTTGTLVGNITASFITYSAATGDWSTPVEFDFGMDGMQGIFLRGAAESLCVNNAGNAVAAGAALTVAIQWLEQ